MRFQELTEATAIHKSEIPEKYRNLPVIGKGMTSIVLDKGDGTVIMLTRDAIKADWLVLDWGLNLGRHLETISSNNNYKLKDFDIYVIEIPKLLPLSLANKRKLKIEFTNFDKIRMSNINKRTAKQETINQYLKEFPETELAKYLEFLQNYDESQFYFDAALRNAMENTKGEIILVDPVVSKTLLDLMRKS